MKRILGRHAGPLIAGATLVWAGGASADEAIQFNEIASVHQNVIIPIPAEVFNVLDKFDVRRDDWRGELKVPKELRCNGRTHTALFLGSVVAEGFVAVEAKDAQAITELGKAVRDLAGTLGLDHVVVKHSRSVIEAANKGDWDKVRAEFDATRRSVNEEMDKRKDQDLAHCVSLGGWVRGTEVVSAILMANFSQDRSDVLHQPDLLEHLFNATSKIPEDARLKAVAAGLANLKPLMSKEGLSLKEVQQIHDICKKLVEASIAP